MKRLIFSSLLLIYFFPAFGKDISFYVIDLKGEVGPGLFRIVDKGIREAEKQKSDYILFNINTYGGAVDAADSIRTSILKTPITTVAFINHQAVSAGALISIACDSIYMSNGSTFGASTVVNQTGEVMPDKYQAFMRAMMRSTAQVNGRDPSIAESMVTDSIKVLSLTPEEAISIGYCEGSAESVEEVAQIVSKEVHFIINKQNVSLLDKIISFLISPYLQGIFLMFIIGGIYFEMQSPGLGMPSIIAILGALLYFMPLYIEGLAENWEIIIFVIGILLILTEIFIIPGFGIAGVTGLILTITGLVFAMIDNDLFYYRGKFDFVPVIKPLAIVLVSSFLSLLLSIFLASRFSRGNRFFTLSLNTELRDRDGFVGVKKVELLEGEEGVVKSRMYPSGKVEINGIWYEATMENGTALPGDRVKIVKSEGGRLYCEHLPL
ncbi:MAG: nodulation protein NfeD [Rikenellaceae bacterium]|nr:nodulation protein NfeD [Rikenellaceae bacterium]